MTNQLDTAAIRAQMKALEGFTPGPWATECDDCHFGSLSSVRGGGAAQKQGLHLHRELMVEVGGWQGVKAQEATTRLIASAPDMHATIIALCDEVDRLNAAIVRQAGAARTLRESTLAEVQHLKDMDRSEYHAAASLDSERLANEILTDESDKLRAENKMLRGLIADAVEIIYRADNTEGTCCCGENMLDHAEAMDCGHSPVDAGAYHAREWQKDARAALAQKEDE